jgi:hypothetical protein
MTAPAIVLPLLFVAATLGSACRSELELPAVSPPPPVDDHLVVGCEQLTLGTAQFFGSVDPATGEMTYVRFGVNLRADGSAVGVPAFLRAGDRHIRLAEAIPDTRPTEELSTLRGPGPPSRVFRMRENDSDDAGVDLTYSAARASSLSARCYRGQRCDFWIGWEGYPMFTLPVREAVLKQALPSAGTARTCRSPF